MFFKNKKFSYALVHATGFAMLNCLGIGIMQKIPYMAQNATQTHIMYGWIVSFLIAWGITAIFAHLAVKYNKYGMHDIIAAPLPDGVVKKYYKIFIFYIYIIQNILSEVVFAIVLSGSVSQLLHIFHITSGKSYLGISLDLIIIMCVHCVVLGIIFCMQYTTEQTKKILNSSLSLIKIIITCGVPLITMYMNSNSILYKINFQTISSPFFSISAYMMILLKTLMNIILSIFSVSYWSHVLHILYTTDYSSILPSISIYIQTQLHHLYQICNIAFDTTWSLSGAESVVMTSSIPLSVAHYAIFGGLFFCTAIYMFNTFVCIQYVDLAKCREQSILPYAIMLPASQAMGNAIVNILIVIMSFGSIYGWFEVIREMVDDNQEALPSVVQKYRKSQFTLILLITFICIIIAEIFKKHDAFTETIFNVINISLIMIYIGALLSYIYEFAYNRQR